MKDPNLNSSFGHTEMSMAIPKVQLKFDYKIGEGSFGEVHKGIWSPTSLFKVTVAIKQLKNTSMSVRVLEDFRREVEIQSKLDSAGVVKLYGITAEQPYCMVMEFMERGSLRDVLDSQTPEQLGWDIKLQMAINMSKGLAYLHGQNPIIIHRDLKSLNILVNEKYETKLADFGLATLKTASRSRRYAEDEGKKNKGPKGSFLWLAPELFRLTARHTPASDIFSLAIVFWELASHLLPYENTASEDVIKLGVTQGEREEFDHRTPNTPKEYIELTQRCWDAKPENRPSAEKITEELETIYSSFSLVPTLFSGVSQPKLSPRPVNKVGTGSGGYLVGTNAAAPPYPAPAPPKKTGAGSGYLANTAAGSAPVKSGVEYLAKSVPPNLPQKNASQKMPPAAVPKKPVPAIPIAATPNARVNEKAQSVSVRVKQEAITELLNFTIRGQLDEVRECLRRNSDLVYAQGDITDLSNRTFPMITGFQYAVWSGDEELWNVFLEFLPEAEACDQLMALTNERLDIIETHGGPLSFFDPLLTAYQRYIDNYDTWSTAQCEVCWQKEVGGAQRSMPAWFIYVFSEEGEDRAWPTKQMTRGFTRKTDQVTTWFETEYDDGKCGATFAFYRERRRTRLVGAGMWGHSVLRDADPVYHDLKSSATLKAKCTQKLAVLTERLSQASKSVAGTSSPFGVRK